MRTDKWTRLSNDALLRTLAEILARERLNDADLLPCIAEIDGRRLYAPAGYSSMFRYCVRELHMSEDVAYKRIRAARAGRRFPAILAALADGRLHLSAVALLKRHLTTENVDELVAAATHRTKAEIEQWLAERNPRPDMVTRIRALPERRSSIPEGAHVAAQQADVASGSAGITPALMELAPGPVEESPMLVDPAQTGAPSVELAPGPVRLAPAGQDSTEAMQPEAAPPAARSRVTPLGNRRFGLQTTFDQETHDLLRHAQALLSHAIPSGDVAQLLKLALQALVEKTEKRKFAATQSPRPVRARRRAAGRYVPAAVKRAVRERDEDRCTFVSEDGQRCEARDFLEFEHVDPVARGGQATVDRVRLMCRTHNQYEAERVFGAGFMDAKRQVARRAAENTRDPQGLA